MEINVGLILNKFIYLLWRNLKENVDFEVVFFENNGMKNILYFKGYIGINFYF